MIKKELKHFQCDVVLNDGAPNVGTDWNLDAYMQIELSLHALKLATQVLKKGGTFVTKVFRSKDYNSFLFVLNQLFTKVESSKPSASRSQSAEIFMVCMGYKACAIDERLLDPKYAFEDISGVVGNGEAADASQQISSLKKLIDTKKKKAVGYDDEDLNKNVLYNVADMSDFLTAVDPYEFLTKLNKVSLLLSCCFQERSILSSISKSVRLLLSIVQHRQRRGKVLQRSRVSDEGPCRPLDDMR